MKFLCRVTDHELSHQALDAFAEGTPSVQLAPIEFDLGNEIPVYYGILRGCKEAIKEDMRAGRPWVYIDHGYFGDHDNQGLTGHYRMVVGGLHHRIPENPTPVDMNKVFVGDMRSWPHFAPIVLVPPSEAVADFYGIDVREWVERFSKPFSPISKPPVIVSTKAAGNLEAAMTNCRGVFAHSSQAAVKALMAGIPAWCTAERAPVPNHAVYDRRSLLCWLAERHFTLGEIRNGDHLGHLRREVEAFGGGEEADQRPGAALA